MLGGNSRGRDSVMGATLEMSLAVRTASSWITLAKLTHWHPGFYSTLFVYGLIACACVHLGMSQHGHVTACTCHGYVLWGQSSAFWSQISPSTMWTLRFYRHGGRCLCQHSFLSSPMFWYIIRIINIIITTYKVGSQAPKSDVYLFLETVTMKKTVSWNSQGPCFLS